MPILIQHSVTGKFVAPKGHWTRNFEKALRFDQVLRAWDEIGERKLSGIRIVILSRTVAEEITVPVGAV